MSFLYVQTRMNAISERTTVTTNWPRVITREVHSIVPVALKDIQEMVLIVLVGN